MIGIGIDTGGTYTDAVIYDSVTDKILDAAKFRTTREDLTICIREVLHKLNRDLLRKTEMIALSTTLATNACLEDKGGRSRALVIGVDEAMAENIKDVHLRYGFRNPEQIIYMNGKPENLFRDAEEPDWNELRKQAKEWFTGCRCAAVTQIYPEANGARYEKTARSVIREECGIPVTIASELSGDVDVMKRNAATFLNARLIPLVSDFMEAVGQVLAEMNLSIPLAIVTSDGSLLTRELAAESPVSTLLSGPAASAVGGTVLADGHDAIVIDMGGTTTDIALVRNGQPVMSTEGISIGPWKTTVRGLKIHTTLLGGDSAVRYEGGRLILTGDRVIPLSVLAETYPGIVRELQNLADQERKHTRMLHEYMVLQRPIPEEQRETVYTKEECAICDALANGPLRMETLAERVDQSIYTLSTRRLEEEGILIRSGLTPTDMMVIKGDITFYRSDAAKAALQVIEVNIDMDHLLRESGKDPSKFKAMRRKNISEDPINWEASERKYSMRVEYAAEYIADAVYRMVEKKLYCNIASMLFEAQHGTAVQKQSPEALEQMLIYAFEDAYSRLSKCNTRTDDVDIDKPLENETGEANEKKAEAADLQGESSWMNLLVHTDLPLVGVGAPTHVFLERVAQLLGTRAVISPWSEAANALGAISGKVITHAEVRVKAEYEGATPNGFSVMDEEKKHFEHYEDALQYGESLAKRLVRQKAERKGSSGDEEPAMQYREVRSGGLPAVFFETVITATIVGSLSDFSV